MKYAKCIRSSQIANNVEDFLDRQGEENCVYCVGQVTTSKVSTDTLYCVPLNYIYDCLKYGFHIAIVKVDNDEHEYPSKSSYMGLEHCSSKQHITEIMDSREKSTIDYVFNEVGNVDIIHSGYIHYLPNDIKEYFKQKLSCENKL